jgi:hypothetical protein
MNQCFQDGNRRIAWMAATDVLLALGVSLDATDDDGERMMNEVIEREIANWEGCRKLVRRAPNPPCPRNPRRSSLPKLGFVHSVAAASRG